MEDFMNNINSLLITASLLTLSQVCFATQTDNDNNRYEKIVAAYSTEKNSFDGFAVQDGDLNIIEEHKKDSVAKLNSYKASWIPAILKTIGIGFGLDAASNVLGSVMFFDPTAFFETLKTSAQYISNAIYPVSKPRSLLTKQATGPLFSQLLTWKEQGKISKAAYQGGTAAVYDSVAIFSAGIATYLFKKANSYQEEIEHLQEEIDLDINMLNLLQP